jgi:Flp pilus assembly protein TadG
MKMRSEFMTARNSQRGAAMIEFALIALIFLSFLLGIMEMGRVLFTYTSAAEATRYGARVAVVCDPNSSTLVLNKMKQIMPGLAAANVSVVYSPGGCGIDTCQRVTVSIQNFSVRTVIPIIGLTFTLPSFTTTLPRESLDSASGSNPICT